MKYLIHESYLLEVLEAIHLEERENLDEAQTLELTELRTSVLVKIFTNQSLKQSMKALRKFYRELPEIKSRDRVITPQKAASEDLRILHEGRISHHCAVHRNMMLHRHNMRPKTWRRSNYINSLKGPAANL